MITFRCPHCRTEFQVEDVIRVAHNCPACQKPMIVYPRSKIRGPSKIALSHQPRSFYEFLIHYRPEIQHPQQVDGDSTSDIACFLRRDRHAPKTDAELYRYLVKGGRTLETDGELKGEYRCHAPVPEDAVDEAWELYTGVPFGAITGDWNGDDDD